jgi:hypothetical protein
MFFNMMDSPDKRLEKYAVTRSDDREIKTGVDTMAFYFHVITSAKRVPHCFAFRISGLDLSRETFFIACSCPRNVR